MSYQSASTERLIAFVRGWLTYDETKEKMEGSIEGILGQEE